MVIIFEMYRQVLQGSWSGTDQPAKPGSSPAALPFHPAAAGVTAAEPQLGRRLVCASAEVRCDGAQWILLSCGEFCSASAQHARAAAPLLPAADRWRLLHLAPSLGASLGCNLLMLHPALGALPLARAQLWCRMPWQHMPGPLRVDLHVPNGWILGRTTTGDYRWSDVSDVLTAARGCTSMHLLIGQDCLARRRAHATSQKHATGFFRKFGEGKSECEAFLERSIFCSLQYTCQYTSTLSCHE